MIEQEIYEQYYQAWIKRNLKKIMLVVAVLVTMGIITETYHHIQHKHQLQAQGLFEQYTQSPDSQTATYLKANYPRYVQTHLVLFSEAKLAYEDNDLDAAISHLEFIRQNSKVEGIQKVACYRLSHIYLQQEKPEQAREVLSTLKEDAYQQLQLALTLSDPDEQKAVLNHALSLSESPYINNLIAIAQNNTLEQ